MMHKAWSSLEEVPYCFWRSYVKFQGHTAKKASILTRMNWAFPDCNSSLNSQMAMKCCTKLETAKERSSIVFQGHPSNFKVTQYKTSPILTQIGRFRTIGQSQLSNPSDLPCSYFFILFILNSKSFIKFTIFNSISQFLRIELFFFKYATTYIRIWQIHSYCHATRLHNHSQNTPIFHNKCSIIYVYHSSIVSFISAVCSL